MLRVMEMSTGKTIEDEFGSFEFEVMNTGWLPPQPALQLGLQAVEHQADRVVAHDEVEVEAFLRRLYGSV